MELRDYQVEALEKVDEARKRGIMRQLGVAATGLGKTIMFTTLAKRLDVPTIVLVHRDELANQAVHKFQAVWPGVDIGVVKAERNEWDHQVVVASVQTLARATRREQLPRDHFMLLVTDEAHHAEANSYQNIYEWLRVGLDGGPLHLGVTATPDRGDGKGLESTYDEIVFTYDLLWGIRAGYLADMRGLRVYLDVDFTKAKVRRGDYDAGETGQMLADADAPEIIAKAWEKHASERKTIVFTPTVDSAMQCMQSFRERGVRSEIVHANTPLDERRQMLKDFEAGDIRVMCNCGVLTEGFDSPAVDCIVMARPTKSRALYAQCVGRGSRRHPDKTDCLVMDVCGVSDMHNLVTIPSLFGFEKEEAFEEAEETVAEVAMFEEEEKIREGKLKARKVDLFKQVLESPINWVHFTTTGGERAYTASLGSKIKGTVVIEYLRTNDDAEDLYSCYVRWDHDAWDEEPEKKPDAVKQFPSGDWYRVIINDADLELAQGSGEDYIRKHGVGALTNRKAKWRDGPPTQRQLDAANKWGIPFNPAWTKGTIGDAITEKAEQSKLRKKNTKQPQWLKDKIAKERAEKAKAETPQDDDQSRFDFFI